MTPPAHGSGNASPAAPGRDVHVSAEPSPRRVRAALGGETVADSTRALLLRETGHVPVYYFPRADVRMDLLAPTDRRTHCPHKGDASYFTVRAGGRDAENAAWSYETPLAAMAPIREHVAFYWDRMEHWYEEDEEVFVHPRDPYVRVDVLDSSRPVRVVLAGETVAETARARFLFETSLPTRYYVPPADVRTDLLEPSATRTRCPYKGEAHHHSARIGGRLHRDVAWRYPAPLPEARRVAGYFAFYDGRVDAIHVDGAPVPKPGTKRPAG